VFSCYTGLAYIDVRNLTEKNIIRGIDGGFWISSSREKTDVPIKIPLLESAIAILDKYRNYPKLHAEDTLLPVISNQKMNFYIKKVAEKAKIEKSLSFHTARHTFATTVALGNGMPIETVSKLLGHKKLTTTQVYARVVERKISEDMQILQDTLHKRSKNESSSDTHLSVKSG
ncbi:MAG: site-specific integrase, partial [Bacteroidota bacterium]